MRPLLLLLPVLLCTVQVGAEGVAMKLCGREFLRAVVYTCGGSRWRRLLTEQDVDEEQGRVESPASRLGTELARRDINNILTTACCKLGCRKSDLAFLC